MKNRKDISFVIPCYNEANHINDVVAAIRTQIGGTKLSYEIIVMDNQSTDASARIASQAGARVETSRGSTVAQVRNEAFQHCRGEIIIFLDGDVLLVDPWGAEISDVVNQLMINRLLITGSHCAAPENLTGPLAAWYSAIEKHSRDTHLGTGHMIVHRDLFSRAGMFNENLSSGEDYDFCSRAKKLGAEVKHNKRLRAYHLGYPATIKEFIKRECWHGAADYRNLSSFATSRVSLACILYIAAHLILLVGLLTLSGYMIIASLILTLTLLVAGTLYKFGRSGARPFILRLYAMYLYLLGRSLAARHATFWRRD